jgi:predicted nucleic acid-binding protein
LGGRVISKAKALRLLNIWLKTDFSNEKRHKRRLDQLDKIPAAIAAKRKYYIDTSVPNYVFAKREPEHVFASSRLFKAIGRKKIKAFISTVVIREIGLAPEPKRSKLLNLVRGLDELKLNKRAEDLAASYIKGGVVPAKYFNDALHIALAVVNRIDCLVSWNFKHMVNIRAKEKVNHLNYKLGFGFIDLISPEEVSDE